VAPAEPAAAEFGDLLAATRTRLGRLVESLALPAGVDIAGSDLTVSHAGVAVLDLVYTAASPLPPQAEEMLQAQVRRALGLPGLEVRVRRTIPLVEVPVPPLPDTLGR
jgi:hypothetical protein